MHSNFFLLSQPDAPRKDAGLWAGLNAAVGDLDGDGYAELAVAPDRGGPAHVKVWSGATLASNRGVQASGLGLAGSFYAFAPTDPSGARLAMRDTNEDGRAELVTASPNRGNGRARAFTFEQVRAAGAGAPEAYPFGTPATCRCLNHTKPDSNPIEIINTATRTSLERMFMALLPAACPFSPAKPRH